MSRRQVTELPFIASSKAFTTGSTVVVEVWRLDTGAQLTLTSDATTEVGTTGVMRFDSSNIQAGDRPAAGTERTYLIRFFISGTQLDAMREFSLGGYPDALDANISTRSTPAEVSAVQTAILTAGGTGPWTTADLTGIALEATVVAGIASILSTGGTGPWTTADLTGIATSADVTAAQTAIINDLLSLHQHVEGRARINTSNDAQWTEERYNLAGDTIIATYNLFDQDTASPNPITSTHNPLMDATVMIAERVPV